MENLTARELQILGLAAKGYKNKDISKKLYISYKTLRKHFENIYKKLEVHCDRAAIAWYYKKIENKTVDKIVDNVGSFKGLEDKR